MALRGSAEMVTLPTGLPQRFLQCAVVVLGSATIPAVGLEPMSQAEMAAVAGRDGLTIGINSGLGMDEVRWTTDAGVAPAGSCSGGIAGQHGCTILHDITLDGVDGDLNASLTIDAGALDGQPALALSAQWDRARARVNGASYSTDVYDAAAQGRSFGQFALESEGSFALANVGGIFNSAGGARMALDTQGDLIYRQGPAGSPELSLADMALSLRLTEGAAGGHQAASGTLGLDAGGMFLAAPFAQAVFGFDLKYHPTPTDFSLAGRQPMLFMDWRGGLADMTLRVTPGGLGYNTVTQGGIDWLDQDGSLSGQRSQGLSLLAAWDFDSDFALTIGESGGDRNHVRLYDWRRLGVSTGAMFSMPMILDLVQNGVGAEGLCFGGGFTSGTPAQNSCTAAQGQWLVSGVPAGSAALAALIRDAHLWAYNQKVEYVNADGSNSYDWTLVFTLGKLDADIFLYPEGLSSTGVVAPTGLRADVTLLAQSPGFWDAATSDDAQVRATAGEGWATNTHFLVGDTNVAGTGGQFATGIVNADLHWQARDLYLRVTAGDSTRPEIPGGFWMQTDNQAQYRFRGLLGGANLEDMTEVTALGLLDVNLLTDSFLFALSPATPDLANGTAPVAFNGLLDLQGAYLSFAEVSNPRAEFRLDNVSGRIGWQDGQVGLRNADGEAQLYIANNLVFGRSADFGGAPGEPLIGNVRFGSEQFGRVVLPEGQWQSDIRVRIPH